MAVPPTIPTSFVPKQPVEMHPRHTESGGNMFMVVGAVILGIAALVSIGIFAYAHYLDSETASKAAELEQAQASVSEDTVNGFIRLKDRLSSADTILNDHVVLSQFFDTLESLTLTDVRFSTLTLTVNDDHSASIKMAGTAKNFNALAAQSAAFTSQPLIHQAIFSGITVDSKSGQVSFTVDAELDPKLVNISSTGASVVPAATTSNATTTP